MFRKNRAARQELTAAQAAVASVVLCLVSEADDSEVRSSVVLHHGGDPALPLVILNLGFCDDDRHGLYMDGDLTVLVYEAHGAPDASTAESKAREWLPKGESVDLRYLPGIHQAAFVEYITGIRQEPHMSHHAWARPPIGGMHMFRRFPPKLGADTERVFVGMPCAALDEMFATRGW